MPQLPDAYTLGTRLIPQSSRPIASYQTGQVGQALEQAGQQVSRGIDEFQQKQGRLEIAYAKSALLKSQVEAETALDGDQDYKTFTPRYSQSMAAAKATAAGMISDPTARKLFEADADMDITRGYASVQAKARQKEKEYGQAQIQTLHDQSIDLMMQTGDESQRSNIAKTYQDAVAASRDKGYISPEQAVDQTRKFTTDYAKRRADLLIQTDPSKAYEMLKPTGGPTSPSTSGFDASIQTVLKNEGGFTAIDGSSGAPAIYGINQKWHPDAYAEAKRLTDTKGEQAGQEYAKQFYKTEFWDKKGIDTLPPATQAIVLDGVVNHTTAFGNKLVDAAKNGASPDELIAMRRGEYQRLVQANPDKYAQSLDTWNTRLDTIKQASGTEATPYFKKTGDWRDFLSPEDRLRGMQQAQSEIKQQIEIRDKDPMTYAQMHGLTPNQPLTFNDPAALSGQLQNRAAAAETLHQQYGAPVKVFTDEEVKHVSSALQDMPTNTQLSTLKTVRDSLPDPQMYQAALQQIRPDSPVTAMAGMYLGIDKTVTTQTHWFRPNDTVSAETIAQHLLDGERLLNPTKVTKQGDGTGKIFPMPKDSGSDSLRTLFNDQVGDSFRGQPMAADQAYQAVRAYYAAEAAKRGVFTGDLDSDIGKLATKAVIGNVLEKNGKHIIAPWGMDETTFNDLAKTAFDKQASNVKWDDVTLENTGEPARYRALVGAGYLLGQDGKPLTINVSPPIPTQHVPFPKD